MASTAVHCIWCGAQVTGTDGKAQCHSCGQEFEYTMVARAQQAIPYRSATDAAEDGKVDLYCRTSFYLSLISCVPLVGVLAIVLAINGLVRANRNHTRGIGLATTAIVVGAFGTVFSLGIILKSLPAAHASAVSISCQSNVRQIGLAIQMYENDFPGAQGYGWSDILPYTGSSQKAFQCPSLEKPLPTPSNGGVASSYILLGSLQPFEKLRNKASLAIAFEPVPHHAPAGDGHIVLFADGHVEPIRPEDLPELIESSLLQKPSATRKGLPDTE